MRLMMTGSFGLVLTLAAMAQAQSDTSKNVAQPVPDQQNLNLIIDSEALQNVYQASFRADPQQPSYFINPVSREEASGLSLAPVDEAARTHLKLPKGQGLIATSVLPQGPAAQAGISQNDILLTLDDVPLTKPEDLEEKLKSAGDKPLNLVLLHHGQKKTLQIQPKVKVTFGPVQPAAPEFWIGVSVTPVEPALRAQLQIPADQGLITTGVIENTPAVKAGLKVNDILLTMRGSPLRNHNEFVKLVQENGEKPLAVELIREGSRQTIEVTPERRKDVQLRISQLQHTGNWNVVHPGAVIQSNQPGFLVHPGAVIQSNQPGFLVAPDGNWTFPNDLSIQGVRSFDTLSAQHPADPLANRLDTMASEIKELREAVEELSKTLKDRK